MAATCSVPGTHSGGGHGCSSAPGSVAPCSRYRVDGSHLFSTRHLFRRWPWEQPRAWIRGTVQPVQRRWRPPVQYPASVQAVATGAAPRLDPWHRAAGTASMAAACSVPGIRSGGGHGCSHTTPRPDPWHRVAGTAPMAAACFVPGIRSDGGHGCSPGSPSGSSAPATPGSHAPGFNKPLLIFYYAYMHARTRKIVFLQRL